MTLPQQTMNPHHFFSKWQTIKSAILSALAVFIFTMHIEAAQEELHRKKADSLYVLYQRAITNESKLNALSSLVQEIHYSDSALKYYNEAIELSRILGNKELEAQNINRLGVYYRNMNLQEEALKLYEEALELSLESKENIQIGHSLNNIGQMYFYREYYDEALEYYEQAEKYFLEVDDKNGLGYNYTGMSLVLGELGRYREALEKINLAIKIREELGQTRQVMVSKYNKADLLIALGNYQEAENDIQKLYEYGLVNDKVRAVNALEKLVELKVKSGDINQAIQYAEKAHAIHQEKPVSESMIAVYQMMNQIYFNLGDYEKSKIYQELLQKERNVIKEEKTKIYLAGLTIQKQKEEIEFLNREKALIEQNEKFKLYLTYGLIFLVLVVSIAFFIAFWAFKREKYNHVQLSIQKQQIENQSLDLEKLNKVKDKIFTILAHDLKSPLNSLSGLIRLIKDDNLTKEEFSEYIPIISQNLGYNKILLENLLVWSRSQLKGLELNEKVFNLSELIQSNMNLLYHSGYYKGQILVNEISEDTLAYADKSMIDIVVRNLLTNSLKFTKENHRIAVSASSKGNKLLIKVSDQGIGIKKENLDKIFANEFFTTPGTHLETGTGIGLFLVKELVEFNKGSIWVESEFGLGTDFYFEIPKA